MSPFSSHFMTSLRSLNSDQTSSRSLSLINTSDKGLITSVPLTPSVTTLRSFGSSKSGTLYQAAEMMDDENQAWGKTSKKSKRHS
ncbi:hypothetical protein C8Q75DRAFT_804142 [Abortiporus biennis]|nr:hypothetical protein C8Q75DRAFT_804142 [Abortiporus biennis]